ncbi:SUMF1/EgtB/PvdO family nonheme iron enzyme [Candidatus Poribacteria bacterium]
MKRPAAKSIVIRDRSGKQVGLYENSYALVIGVSDYNNGWPVLPGVKKDVAAVKEALERHSFNITMVENPADCAQLDQAFTSFINRFGQSANDRLLFYFAGHGHTLEQTYGGEMGYIVPAGAPDPNTDNPGFLAESVDMQMVEVYAKRIQSKHALFLFDSCFSGSLFVLSRAVPMNISYKIGQPVRQFITAGSVDEPVPDESIFCQQFIAALNGDADTDADGYITGVELGEFLQKNVINYSNDLQHPQYGKIRDARLDKGDFVLQIPKPEPKPISMKMPSGTDFSIDDLIEEAEKIEAAKAAWAEKLQEMDTEFRKVKSFGKRDVPSDWKVAAWERFLDAFAEDNPCSEEDDQMRQVAVQQIAYWKDEVPQHTKSQSKEPPSSVEAATIEGKDGAEMVLIPAGDFEMGTDESGIPRLVKWAKKWRDVKADRFKDETPRHTVYLDSFYMDKYQVTNTQYARFLNEYGKDTDTAGHELLDASSTHCLIEKKGNTYKPKDGYENHPVIKVSWYGAAAYAQFYGKRLPTEAQWEKAARGGLERKKFPWGDDDPDGSRCSFTDKNADDGYKHTAPVGSYPLYGYGLHDMAGNVWEWCADEYDSGYYGKDVKDNPMGPGLSVAFDDDDFASVKTVRVLRGGSWENYRGNLRVSRRLNYGPTYTISNVGFRCVSQD